MAKKKSTRTKKSSAVQSTQPVAPSLPSYEELLTARHHRDKMHACVGQAERQLRSARTINTFAERDIKVAAARERLNECRSDAAEATFKFEDLKRKARG